jgi:ribulose-phosphate 3-epimerase
MARPAAGWIDRLPSSHLITEFSIWSSDLLRLADEVQRVAAHADVLHVDVSDGVFANTLLLFPEVVSRIRKITDLPIHVHLMVGESALINQINQFAEAGADAISIHAENTLLADSAIARINQLGLIAGIVLRVETPVAKLVRHLPRVSFVTLFGAPIGEREELDRHAIERLNEARKYIDAVKVDHRITLIADGAIREDTVPELRKAGAQAVIAGRLVFGASDLTARMKWLRSL